MEKHEKNVERMLKHRSDENQIGKELQRHEERNVQAKFNPSESVQETFVPNEKPTLTALVSFSTLVLVLVLNTVKR